MKYNIIILFFAVIAFSCDSVDDLLKTSAEYSIDQTVNVDLGTDDPATFSATQEFDASGDVSQFGSHLDKIEIKGISMEFKNYVRDGVTITDANLEFVGTGFSLSIKDIDLDNVISETTGTGVVNLTTEGIDFTAINEKFLADKKVSVKVTTTVDKVPVTFDVTFTIDIEVTGSI